MPWLGYFYKILQSDDFIFLDNVQFTKGGYTNRVRIAACGKLHWLTIPLSVHLGELICGIELSDERWVQSHLSLLLNSYRAARHFKSVWPEVKGLYESMNENNLSSANIFFIKQLLFRLKIDKELHLASEFKTAETSDGRLIEIVRQVDPQGTYLSGKGGEKYQDPQKFIAAGVGFQSLGFRHPAYDQGRDVFEPGLSILDALFHLGFEGTADLLRNCGPA